jgi:hypothetical protein
MHINPTQTRPYAFDIPYHQRQIYEGHDRIINSGLTFDSSQHNDFLSTGGTLNRSRSLSDITDYEDLTHPSRRFSSQPNTSFFDPSGRIPLVGEQTYFSSTQIGSIPDRNEACNTSTGHFLPRHTEQVFASSRAMPPPTQRQVRHQSEGTILNRYTSQQVQSILHDIDQFHPNVSDPIAESAAITGQDYLRTYHDPTQRNQTIGSFHTDPFHLQSTNLSRLQQLMQLSHSLNANNSIMSQLNAVDQSTIMPQNNESVQVQYHGEAFRNETTVPPHYLYQQQQQQQQQPQHSYRDQTTDFVRLPEDVEIGYAVPSPPAQTTAAQPQYLSQLQSTAQLPQPGYFTSSYPMEQAIDRHAFNTQQTSYQTTQPFIDIESSLQYLQQLHRSSFALNQPNLFQPTIDDRNLYTHQTNYEVDHPHQSIASTFTNIQHLNNDNNVIHAAGLMFPMTPPYGPTTTNVDRYANDGNGILTQEMPSDFVLAHQQQSGDDHNNQSSDESQFWEL